MFLFLAVLVLIPVSGAVTFRALEVQAETVDDGLVEACQVSESRADADPTLEVGDRYIPDSGCLPRDHEVESRSHWLLWVREDLVRDPSCPGSS